MGWGAGHRDTDVGPMRPQEENDSMTGSRAYLRREQDTSFNLTTVVRYTGSRTNPFQGSRTMAEVTPTRLCNGPLHESSRHFSLQN